MSEVPANVAAAVERTVAVATITTPRGAVSAVVREAAPVATVAGAQGIAGPPGPPAPPGSGGTTLVIQQQQAASVWTLTHGLGRFPGLVLVDSAGDVFDADARYVDANTIVVTLIAPTAGTAYLN